jgi:hypothetical protein
MEKIVKCKYNYGRCSSDDEGELVPCIEEGKYIYKIELEIYHVI